MNAPAAVAPLAVQVAEADDARLDPFVRAHPQGRFFHLPKWTAAVEKGTRQRGHYLVAEQGRAVRGVLPLSEIRSPLFGNALVSAGFGTGGGILAEDERAAEALARAAWELAGRLGCATAELRGGPVPDGWQASTGTYANFDRALSGDAESLLGSVPKRQRREVRRALTFGLESTSGTDKRHRDAHYRVYAESVRNLGTPVFPRRLFEAALDAFGDEAWINVIWKRGRPLAALLGFNYGERCCPYWGGGTREARQWRANDLIYYEMMRRALEAGCTQADFGRSKIGTGPWARKKIWELDETPLTYAVRTVDGEAPRTVNPLDPKYKLKIAAWQKLPLWAANRLGPLISRGLG
jgi:FemAB-related protein (PEP-CTERM system-associated)